MKILLVDDDEMVLNATTRVLESMDHEVYAYVNPETALVGVTNANIDPDMVITDFRMPEMNGLQFATDVKKMTHNQIPVLMISGDMAKYEGKEVGDVDWVMGKPTNMVKLQEAIDRLTSEYGIKEDDGHSPRYEHDCDGCRFLGRISSYDAYVCGDPAGEGGGTVILRFSDFPSDNHSGWNFAMRHGSGTTPCETELEFAFASVYNAVMAERCHKMKMGE